MGNFLERKKPVAVGTEINKSCFETGFDPSNLGLVNIGFSGAPGAVFNVEIVKALSVHKSNPDFLGLRGIDEHFFHGGSPVGETTEQARNPT